jgi:hypothetical protein
MAQPSSMKRGVLRANDLRVARSAFSRRTSSATNVASPTRSDLRFVPQGRVAACLARRKGIGYKGRVAAAPEQKRRGRMYAIVYKSDGFPICREVAGVTPDPVVTWNTEEAAKAFIFAKGGDNDFLPVALTDEAMDKLAVSMGCPVESITFDPYPG